MKDNRVLGKNMLAYLDQCRISRIELARRLEVTPTAVSDWVNGHRMPRMKYIDRMCEIFRCSVNDLLGEPRTAEEIQRDLLTQRIIDFTERLTDEGKEKVLTYMQDLSGRFLK